MTKKEEALEVEGVVTQALANTRFRVQLDDGPEVMAHVAGRMRKHFIRIVPGDRVRVEPLQLAERVAPRLSEWQRARPHFALEAHAFFAVGADRMRWRARRPSLQVGAREIEPPAP